MGLASKDMKLKDVSDEVLYVVDPVAVIDVQDITRLKERSRATPRKRSRICAHRDTAQKLHEMFIVHEKHTYIRPHRHLNKAESIHVIEGLADLVLFSDEGRIEDVLPLGDYASSRGFFCRMSESRYHTLLIHSELLVFHETTTGPFDRADTVFAPWAPDEADEPARNAFFQRVLLESQVFLKHRDETTKR